MGWQHSLVIPVWGQQGPSVGQPVWQTSEAPCSISLTQEINKVDISGGTQLIGANDCHVQTCRCVHLHIHVYTLANTAHTRIDNGH